MKLKDSSSSLIQLNVFDGSDRGVICKPWVVVVVRVVLRIVATVVRASLNLLME